MQALRLRRKNITRLLVAGTLLAAASPADAARRPSVYGSPLLWVTVNACDTVDRPNTVGIRASMPGSRERGERMWVRLQVQYRDLTGRWRSVGEGGDSGWIRLGHARVRARQAGTDFKLRVPRGVDGVLLRGAATFEWRRGDEVVRRARKRTEGGHPGTPGADPGGFSAASCRLR